MTPDINKHAVPNSESCRQLLAQAMGLIPNTKVMSERNHSLPQHRVYAMTRLQAESAKNGLRVIQEGGYLIKPFTHSQMACMSPRLGIDVMNGLLERGERVPHLASEIWGEAEMDDGA